MHSKALLVLERPWWDLTDDPDQTSVLPFLQGLDRLSNDIRVYHATFFDLAGFDSALQHLSSVKERNAILYIASHGQGGRVGGINFSKMLERIGGYSATLNIEGCLLGACEVGGRNSVMLDAMTDSQIAWMAGYSSSIAWLPSMLIDLSILSGMSQLKEKDLGSANKIVSTFANTISFFNGAFELGEVELNGTTAKKDLSSSLTVNVKPRGDSHRPANVTDRVIQQAWPSDIYG